MIARSSDPTPRAVAIDSAFDVRLARESRTSLGEPVEPEVLQQVDVAGEDPAGAPAGGRQHLGHAPLRGGGAAPAARAVVVHGGGRVVAGR